MNKRLRDSSDLANPQQPQNMVPDSATPDKSAPESKSDSRTPSKVSREAPCTHCDLPTPYVGENPPHPLFCCNGCRGAYELIQGWGLDSYYDLRDQANGERNRMPEATDKGRFDSFDDPEFLGLSTPKQQSDGLQSAQLAVHGLHCAACAWLIENAAQQTEGWNTARVHLGDHTLRVMFDPATCSLSGIARLLHRLGYELAPITKQPDAHFRKENRRLLTQIAIAGFCAANAMWIAVALYAGDASGVAAEHRLLLRLMGTGLGLIAVAVPGRTFFRGAFAALRTWTPHMDLPVALGLSVGTVTGTVNAISGRGDVYFDSLAVLVFFLLVGRWIQFHQQHRAAKAVDLLLRITPAHANRIAADNTTDWVLVDTLRPDDQIRVAAGESLPADGIIAAGNTTLDRSLLTGESQPVAAQTGDEVSAGTLNLSRSIDVTVRAVGSESRIGRVMQSVESAMAERTPIVQLADAIGGWFVVIVTLLAIAALVIWSGEGWGLAAGHATALLIVACPCALALATPLAIAVSLGRAAKRKILIRDGASLQLLASKGILWFDKTGTLTEGRSRAQVLYGPETALSDAAAVERDCSHPIASAIERECLLQGLTPPDDAELLVVETGGVQGVCEGRQIVVGNIPFLTSKGIVCSAEILAAVDASLQIAATPIVIAVDGVATTVLGLSDPLRQQAAETVATLQRRGWQVGILSGDHPAIVAAVAQQIGIPLELAHGGLLPADKLERVRQPQSMITVMIGDGANDAAALAAADVGIAVRGGAEVSLQAAPIFIASGRLTSIVELIRGSSATSKLIRTTFAVSLSYNLFAVGFALAGWISPLLAAVLMPLSSISVLSLTLAWPTFRSP
ncbi:heavy metal translocating P-type ATPase [Roseimaritima multifibrata]|nr:heavy metal translocating P-type ATPase metal-binding domain-containing protein [Roseimaritima multifibrata]